MFAFVFFLLQPVKGKKDEIRRNIGKERRNKCS